MQSLAKIASQLNQKSNRDPRLSYNRENSLLSTKTKNSSPKILTDVSSGFLNLIRSASKRPSSPSSTQNSKGTKRVSVEFKLTNLTVVLDLLPSLSYNAKLHDHDSSTVERSDTALRSAVSDGNTDEVVHLLASQKLPKIEDIREPKLLIVAARKGFADIAGILIRHGADVNVRSQSGSTALFAAANSGHIMVIAVLLQSGAYINIKNTRMETALSLAIQHGHLSCVLLLLAYGANPIPCITSGKTHGHTPLQIARQLKQPRIQQVLLDAYSRIEQYMLNLVQSSLPKNAFLVEPGHKKCTERSLPLSMSFIPVQLISFSESSSFIFTFDTPSLYSNSSSLLDRPIPKTSDNRKSSKDDWVADELILLFLASVTLLDGEIFNSSDVKTIRLSNIEFNGVKNRPEITLVCKAPGQRRTPGCQVFVLDSCLNKGDLNTLTLETKSEANKHVDENHNSRSRLHKWRNSPPSYTDDVNEMARVEQFQKSLLGIYRVRVGVTAFSPSPRRVLAKPSPSRKYS